MEDHYFPHFWSPARAARPPTTPAKPPRPSKVVSIPVHFVGSDDTPAPRTPTAAANTSTVSITRSVAAVRIQSALRGFLVKKNVSAVRRLEAEIDAIDKEVNEEGARLRRDAKERLRVSEALMSVLLRLDSVRRVRNHGRRAIRRAIALQEAVDATATADAAGTEAEQVASPVGGDGSGASDEDAPRGTTEAQGHAEISPAAEGAAETLEDGIQSSSAAGGEGVQGEDTEGLLEGQDSDGGDVVVEEAKREGEMEETGEVALCADSPSKSMDEGIGPNQAVVEALEDADRDESAGDDAVAASMAQDEGGAEERTAESAVTGSEEALPMPPVPYFPSHDMAERGAGGGCGEDMMRLAMERMVEESRGLRELVAELCERNEAQCRLMSGLLQRVEHLEKMVDRTGRRKKKRQAADAKRACCDRKCERRL